MVSKSSAVAKAFLPVDEYLNHYANRGLASGVSVCITHKNTIIHRHSAGLRNIEKNLPMTTDTVCRCYSMAKAVTALAVLQLCDRDLLSLEDPIERFIPELKDREVWTCLADETIHRQPANHPMTIRELLTHSAGFGHGIGQRSIAANKVEQIYSKSHLQSDIVPLVPRGKGSKTLDEFIKKLAALPLRFQPGTEIQYSVSYDVLARLIEQVSGTRIDQYFTDNIFRPLGMNDSSLVLKDHQIDRFSEIYTQDSEHRLVPIDEASEFGYSPKQTFFGGSGQMLSTADDWSRFAMMLCAGGELDGVRLISKDLLENMCTHVNEEPPKKAVCIGGTERGHRVGYGVMVLNNLEEAAPRHEAHIGEYWWAGGAHTYFWVCPQRKLTITIMMQLWLSQCSIREDIKPLVIDAMKAIALIN